jgi:hypothetical protein
MWWLSTSSEWDAWSGEDAEVQQGAKRTIPVATLDGATQALRIVMVGAISHHVQRR